MVKLYMDSIIREQDEIEISYNWGIAEIACAAIQTVRSEAVAKPHRGDCKIHLHRAI
jgi:hypothetical protein